jgi:hypothetical protein
MGISSDRRAVHTQMTISVTMCIEPRDCDDAVYPVYPDLPDFDNEHVEL